MKYISSALFLLSSALTANCLCGTEWTTGIANPFICRLFQNAASAMKGEFIEIYSGGMNLTKEELNDKLQQWAIKQGSETEVSAVAPSTISERPFNAPLKGENYKIPLPTEEVAGIVLLHIENVLNDR